MLFYYKLVPNCKGAKGEQGVDKKSTSGLAKQNGLKRLFLPILLPSHTNIPSGPGAIFQE